MHDHKADILSHHRIGGLDVTYNSDVRSCGIEFSKFGMGCRVIFDITFISEGFVPKGHAVRSNSRLFKFIQPATVSGSNYTWTVWTVNRPGTVAFTYATVAQPVAAPTMV